MVSTCKLESIPWWWLIHKVVIVVGLFDNKESWNYAPCHTMAPSCMAFKPTWRWFQSMIVQNSWQLHLPAHCEIHSERKSLHDTQINVRNLHVSESTSAINYRRLLRRLQVRGPVGGLLRRLVGSRHSILIALGQRRRRRGEASRLIHANWLVSHNTGHNCTAFHYRPMDLTPPLRLR